MVGITQTQLLRVITGIIPFKTKASTLLCVMFTPTNGKRGREREIERERESKQRRTRDPFRIANSAQANDLSLPMSCQPTLLFIHNTFWQSSLEINAYPSLNPDYHSHTYTGIQKTI